MLVFEELTGVGVSCTEIIQISVQQTPIPAIFVSYFRNLPRLFFSDFQDCIVCCMFHLFFHRFIGNITLPKIEIKNEKNISIFKTTLSWLL